MDSAQVCAHAQVHSLFPFSHNPMERQRRHDRKEIRRRVDMRDSRQGGETTPISKLWASSKNFPTRTTRESNPRLRDLQ